MTARWEWATTDGVHVHVLPLDDLVAHLEDDAGECPCGPRVEWVPNGDGDAWVITHASLDGRELTEPDHRP
jgi:hypothetical protein